MLGITAPLRICFNNSIVDDAFWPGSSGPSTTAGWTVVKSYLSACAAASYQALASAAVSVACVNPVDVVRTRLYNAPPGRYASGVEAGLALAQTEGLFAFYKGALTHYLRLGPHMVLVFGFLEQMKKMRS